MRAPGYWYASGEAAWQARLLAPLGWVYAGAGALRRHLTATTRANVPVLCVGNLCVGGTGKTPLVIALGRWLAEAGWTPHAITRGYRGRLLGPVRVSGDHGASEVGDEALLLARVMPTWVSAHRGRAALLAEAEGATCLLLDDGFQNETLRKDLQVLVVDAVRGFGNGLVLPAGPLREPVRSGLARADAVVAMGDSDAGIEMTEALSALPPARLFTGKIAPGPGQAGLAGQAYVAFAGIGRPEKFIESLRGLGANIVESRTFPDHHVYDRSSLGALESLARRHRARLITTEKDHVRLPPDFRDQVEVLPVEVRLDDEAGFRQLIDGCLQALKKNRNQAAVIVAREAHEEADG